MLAGALSDLVLALDVQDHAVAVLVVGAGADAGRGARRADGPRLGQRAGAARDAVAKGLARVEALARPARPRDLEPVVAAVAREVVYRVAHFCFRLSPFTVVFFFSSDVVPLCRDGVLDGEKPRCSRALRLQVVCGFRVDTDRQPDVVEVNNDCCLRCNCLIDCGRKVQSRCRCAASRHVPWIEIGACQVPLHSGFQVLQGFDCFVHVVVVADCSRSDD